MFLKAVQPSATSRGQLLGELTGLKVYFSLRDSLMFIFGVSQVGPQNLSLPQSSSEVTSPSLVQPTSAQGPGYRSLPGEKVAVEKSIHVGCVSIYCRQ